MLIKNASFITKEKAIKAIILATIHDEPIRGSAKNEI